MGGINNPRTEFSRKLLKLIADETGCDIQFGGCPCNTCFHSWAETDLELNGDIAHLFWLVVLALRGDYEQNEILMGNKENFEELVKRR